MARIAIYEGYGMARKGRVTAGMRRGHALARKCGVMVRAGKFKKMSSCMKAHGKKGRK